MSILYREILNKSLLEFIKNVLKVIKKNGLGVDQSCYVSFLVNYPGVELPKELIKKYPNEITIVLQYQFENLIIEEEFFAVTLSFNDIPENIKIPYVAITNFADPSENFHLSITPPPMPKLKKEKNKNIEQVEIFDDNKVISIDKFRNKIK